MKALLFTYISFRSFLGNLLRKYNVYRSLDIFLPSNSYLQDSNRIVVGENFSLSPNCQIFAQGEQDEIRIGKNVSINFNVMINANSGGKIIIGDNVLIGPGTIIRASNHGIKDLKVHIRNQPHEPGEVVIGDNVWIGANCTILPNAHISSGSIIAAGAIVNKSIPPNEIWGGVPAKFIKRRQQ